MGAQGVSGNPVCVTPENGTSFIQQASEQARFDTSAFFAFLLVLMILSLVAFLQDDNSPGDADTISQDSQDSSTHQLGHKVSSPVQYNIYLLLVLQCLVCFLSNGALPSIQSYSCLPYGNTVYHLAVTLSAMANPCMAFLAFFLPCTRQNVVSILTVIGSVLAGL